MLFEYERPDKYIVASEHYSDEYPTPVLTANQSFILGYTDETDGIYTNLPVVLFDDFTCDTKLVSFPFKVKSSAMKLLRSSECTNINFAYALLQHIDYRPQGHSRHWISVMQPLQVAVPSLIEQNKIARLFELINARIQKQVEIIKMLKKYKRGLSDLIFDEIHRNKENTSYVFGDVFTILQNNTFSRDMLSNEFSDVQNIHYGDVLIKFGSLISSECDLVPFIKEEIDLSKFSKESYLLSGDVVFADTAEDYTVGKATEIINTSRRRMLSGLHTIPCRSKIPFASGYLGHYFNSKSFREQILPLIQGTKVSSISKSELLKTTLIVPSIEKQEECSRLLSSFDTKIEFLEQELNKMKQLKGGFLQQLFI